MAPGEVGTASAFAGGAAGSRPTLLAGSPDAEGVTDSERRPLLTGQASNDGAAESERRPKRKAGAA